MPDLFATLRACWEVSGGMIPGQAFPELTRRFPFTSQDRDEKFNAAKVEAYAYAEALTDPSKLNWVRIDWVWF